MRKKRRRIATPVCADRRLLVAALLLVAVSIATIAAPSAVANVGYELDGSTPSRSITGTPHGIAVDQANQRIYVAVVTTSSNGAPGQVDRFESNLDAAGTFSQGSSPYYTGVAVNPLTQGFYAAQSIVHTPLGNVGTPRMDLFTSSGTAGTTFALSDTGTLPQIAVDSNGDVYYPNAATHSVQVFDSTGALQEEIGCGGCTGGSFGEPVSVALNSADDLYVVDLAPDRVVKLTPSGGSYSFASVLQSGSGAAAVAVDPSDDDVLVGDMPNGRNYHIAAYDSSGVQFDDFGAGLFTNPEAFFGALAAAQIAADATTHRLYVGDLNKFYIFDRVTIQPPTATIKPATAVGQLTATLHTDVNVKGHTALECEFEYTDDSDFQLNGFSNATTLPCPEAPVGSSIVTVSAKISKLSPATIYHYRLTVATYGGSATSGGETFETLPVTPATVTTESPTSITQSSATLQAKVNPHGGSVSNCHFEYGTSTAYGTSLSCSKLPEPVTTDVAETRSISGLVTGTTYHYRLVVSSNAGTVNGGDVEFTTSSPPPPPALGEPPATGAPPPPPGAVVPTPVPHPLHCRRGFQKKRVRGKLKCVKKKRHPPRRRARGRSGNR